MLESRIKLKVDPVEDSFGFNTFPVCNHWKSSSMRVLIVIEAVDGKDLHAKKLMNCRSRTVLTNVIKHARIYARKAGVDLPPQAFCVVNFNDARTFGLDPNTAKRLQQEFAHRVRSLIRQLDPTHILMCGDTAFSSTFTKVENASMKRGWVFDMRLGGNVVKVTPTLDLEPLYTTSKKQIDDDDDDDDEGGKDVFGKTNLLFYVIRNFANLLAGKVLFSLEDIKPRPTYVDTLVKVDKLLDKLYAADVFAYDTETKDLTVYDNPIYTMQFSMSPHRGYVVPFRHPQTPWTSKDLKALTSRFREFFRTKPNPDFKYMIGMNLAFDIRVTRCNFTLPIIRYPVWDVMAGETSLDENSKFLENFGTTLSLLNIFMSYGNDMYLKLPFSKQDRTLTGYVKPNDPDFLDYAALDTQSVFGIHQSQLARAELLDFEGAPYTEVYERFVSTQMSDTVHVISHMETRGVNLDRLYLTTLKSTSSPMLKLINEATDEMRQLPLVKKTNKQLLAELGSSTGGGLFNQMAWVFDMNKPKHRLKLFFDVMRLKPITLTKTKQPQTNVVFQKAYSAEHREVALFARIQKLTKLWGTYISGWYTRIVTHPDSKVDGRLRARYGWIKVVTGRLNSFDPSLQQTPTRSAEAKYVKRMFVAKRGCLSIKYDYSAHEVRVWSIISGDAVLASAFKVGQDLRKLLRTCTDSTKLPGILAKIKAEGDIHIVNVKFFFGMLVDKSHPLREGIKQVVFGVIYGKSAGTLAKDIGPSNISMLEKKIEDLKAKIAALENKG